MNKPITPPTIKVTADDIVICRKCKSKDFVIISHFALVNTGVIGAPKQLVTLEQLMVCNHCGEYVERTQVPLTQGEQLRKHKDWGNEKGLINVVPTTKDRSQEDAGSSTESRFQDNSTDGQTDSKSEHFRGRVALPGESEPGNQG